MTSLQEQFTKKAVPAMREKFGYQNTLATPRIIKVVVNTSFGKMASGKTGTETQKIGEAVLKDMSLLTGQLPTLTKARQSIATFKLRQGTPIGAKVTLRGKKMYDFLDRLINIVLPRSRDFRGLKPSSVDEAGNLTLGMREHLFFPEISPENMSFPFGLEITVTTSAKTKEEGLELFKLLGFPFTT